MKLILSFLISLFTLSTFAANVNIGANNSASIDFSILNSIAQGSWASDDQFLIFDTSGNTSKKTSVSDFDARYFLQSAVATIAQGGTNSSTALNNNRMMVSSGGKIVETSAITAGSILFADSNGLPTQDNSNFFWNDSSNFLGLLTSAPTHTVTHGSTSTGAAFYNTADQVTNYERAVIGWGSNIFSIAAGKSGSGTERAMRLTTISATSGLELSSSSSGTLNIIGSSPRIVANSSNVGVSLWGKITTATIAGISLVGINNYTGSSGIQVGTEVLNTINQSNTAGYKALQVNVTETTTGSGQKDLMSLEVGGTSRFRVNNLGDSVISSAATSGLRLYNTADETTNTEFGEIKFSSNTFVIDTGKAGTGTGRNIQIHANNAASLLLGGATGQITGTAAISTGTGPGFKIENSSSFSSTSLVQDSLLVTATVNQASGSGGYRGVVVNPTLTAVGSTGAKLIDLQVSSTSKFTVDSSGNAVASGSITSAGLVKAYVAKTSAYTLTTADEVVAASTSGGAFSLTLPTAVGNTGRVFTIKKTDTSANALTIATTSSQTIDGSTTRILNGQGARIKVVSNGSNWEILASTERYFISYSTNAAGAVTDGNNVLYEDAGTVTHSGDYNAGTGIWTARAGYRGHYRACAWIKTQSVAAGAIGQSFAMNVRTSGGQIGTEDTADSTTSRIFSASNCREEYIADGGTIEFRFNENIPAVNLKADGADNYMFIERLGD